MTTIPCQYCPTEHESNFLDTICPTSNVTIEIHGNRNVLTSIYYKVCTTLQITAHSFNSLTYNLTVLQMIGLLMIPLNSDTCLMYYIRKWTLLYTTGMADTVVWLSRDRQWSVVTSKACLVMLRTPSRFEHACTYSSAQTEGSRNTSSKFYHVYRMLECFYY